MPATTRDVTIRQATGDDLQAVLVVGRTTWPATYYSIAGEDYIQAGLAKWWTEEATIPAIRAGRVTVAEVDGQVVGVATVGPRDGHLVLWKLYVLPEHQGRGIGSALLDAVLENAREDQHEVQLSYLDGNTSAAAFYRHQGFVEFDREAGGGGVPDDIWMRRFLRPADDADDPAGDPS
ncbi:MAG TPA: GNAT family N-acetyltransferase [Segeticoccus sp.]|uniref:GNAT family N-acetyltransferase n=1 Tax=Segeticoccus sp. TaxID=2706531 RepID=UPI002D7F329F|nr:GNAT family N-acetyltransferase [Segeticoccus sp.]HET8601388.1 GNAT family N-acetyltransferase [Segeticoccus sp.]